VTLSVAIKSVIAEVPREITVENTV